MTTEQKLLSHIIVYVDKKVSSDDISAFCTNIKSEEPRMGFTYLCYDNRSDRSAADPVVNLINSLPDGPGSLFIITDRGDLLRDATGTGIACAALGGTDAGTPWPDHVLYCIEDIGFIKLSVIRRMWQRYHGIPWTIADTDRLIIREQEMSDLDSLYDIYDDEEAAKYVEPLYKDRKREEEYLRDYIDNQYRFYEYGQWALVLRETGELIGRAGFSQREGYDIPEIGYIIGKKYRRAGYAKEALNAIIGYGRNELGIEEYMAFSSDRNKASVELLKRLGFCRRGQAEIMGRMHGMYILTKQQ